MTYKRLWHQKEADLLREKSVCKSGADWYGAPNQLLSRPSSRSRYVCREKRTIKLNQPGLYQETSLLQILPQTKLKPNRILQGKESIQLLSNNEKIATKFERKEYQGITGSIMFSLVVETRPDIAFAMSVASRFAKKKQFGSPSHWSRKANTEISLKVQKTGALCTGGGRGGDAGHWRFLGLSGDKESRNSISRYIFILNGRPISWCSERQRTVALSSIEAKYMALTLAAKEATLLRLLLTELGLLEPPDNQHAEINVKRGNTGVQTLKEDIAQKAKESVMPQGLAIEPLSRSVNMSGDNQGSIASAHNLAPFSIKILLILSTPSIFRAESSFPVQILILKGNSNQ